MDERDQTDGLAAVQERLRRFGSQPVDTARQSADLTAMASARPLSSMRPKLRLAGAFLAGLLIGSTGLAAADALPDPAQHVAHDVLGRVGVDVPDPERYHGPECGSEAKRNHGEYVRDDHTLATSDCGKPVKAAGAGADAPGEADEPKADKGSCAGKPAWAGDKAPTAAEKALLQAERRALCGSDPDAPDVEGSTSLESEHPDDGPDGADPAVTTTTTEVSTTTEAPSTTDLPTDSDKDPSTTTAG